MKNVTENVEEVRQELYDKGNSVTTVIDTNLLISGVISKENTTPQQLLNAWRSHVFELCLSDALISELELVLNRERIYKTYNISPEEIAEFLRELRDSTVFIASLVFKDRPELGTLQIIKAAEFLRKMT